MKKQDILLILTVVVLILFFASLAFSIFSKSGNLNLQNEKVKAPAPKIVEKIIPESLKWIRSVPASTSTQGFEKRDSHAVFVFDNKLWVTGGLDSDNSKNGGVPDYEKAIYYNDIWNTSDGLNWTRVKEHASYPPVRSSSIIHFKDALYMIGGWSPNDGLEYKNGIWKSTDGVNWTKVVKTPEYKDREGQKVMEFNGKLWMMGGVDYFKRITYNDVWYSDDAMHWTLATSSAPWHSRWDHDVGIMNGKLWLCGGMNFNGVGYGDEWSSKDGINWELVSELAPWGKRQGQGVVTYGNYLWLISGLDSKTNEGKGDAWFSPDGVNWTKAADDSQWLGREDHGVIIFNNKIWVLGGMDSSWHWNNDIWYSDFLSTSTNSVEVGLKK
ncbi:MAG: hypothetical protein WCP15_00715 [bacterium]